MKTKVYAALVLVALVSLSASAKSSPGDGDQQLIAITNVNVIPMDRERILQDQTVVIRRGRIHKIGPASRLKAPKGARLLDGRGKYLMPGLVDMHTHLFSDDDEFPEELADEELFLMLANGVTTARLMIGTPEQLKYRTQIARGELVGPTLYVASPQLTGRKQGSTFNGRVVTKAEEARAAVRDFKAAGYDFIKLTNFITPEVYEAVIDEAKKEKIRVVGHVDTRVGVRRALEARQQIEHLDAYLESVLKDDSPIKTSVSDIGLFRKENWQSLDFIDDDKVREIAKATARAGIYSTPTLTFFKMTFGLGMNEDEIRARPDFQFVPTKLREEWFAANKRLLERQASEARRMNYVRVRDMLVREIHNAGGKIMAGSDTPELFLLYGWSLHREIRNLHAAGLSPYAALAAATRNPAEFLGALHEIGTIEQGKRADLILLDANPLEDLSNTERRAGVMVRGRWLTAEELQRRLDEIAPRFQHALDEKTSN
ncbi:MAG TPA: amidohydrolase family protein [Pyrinomonadaceae bacterium]|nr:amidohydrolase family protein [Pyrinomonadaceae bacterium]